MRSISRSIALGAAVLALASLPLVARAQPAPAATAIDVPALAAAQTAKLKSQIGLDTAQAQQVNEVLVKSYTSASQLAASQKGVANPDAKALATNLRKIADEQEKALGAILTGNQLALYKKYMPQRVASLDSIAIARKLQLNKTQTTQVSQINTTAASQMASLYKEMPNLRAGQRRGAQDKIEVILHKREQQMQGVLTGAQWEQYKAISKQHVEFLKTMLMQ